ncbi:MAG TPA: hypothetical protein VFF69_15810 [Phycisphaerales bacterium]|nr:hypothetical protein [Phycisphaerales bacterium]
MRQRCFSARPERRRRIWLALSAAAVSFLLALVPDDLSRKASIALARLRGYDGCLCADCGEAFGFQGYNYRSFCGTSRGASASQALAVIGWLTSGILLLTAIDPSPAPSRFPPGHCPACGYDLAGCVLPVCPECGRAADAGHA